MSVRKTEPKEPGEFLTDLFEKTLQKSENMVTNNCLFALPYSKGLYAILLVEPEKIEGLKGIPGSRLFYIKNYKEFTDIPYLNTIQDTIEDLKSTPILFTYKTEKELQDYIAEEYLIDTDPDKNLNESIKERNVALLEKYFGHTKKVLPNGIIKYRIVIRD